MDNLYGGSVGQKTPSLVGNPLSQKDNGTTRLDFLVFQKAVNKHGCCVLPMLSAATAVLSMSVSGRELVAAASGLGGRRKVRGGSCFLFSTRAVILSRDLLCSRCPIPPTHCARRTMASTLLVDKHVSYVRSLGDVRPPPTNLYFLTFFDWSENRTKMTLSTI